MEISYSSIYGIGNGSNGSVNFDGELWRTGMAPWTGIDARSEVEIGIPIVDANSRCLDVSPKPGTPRWAARSLFGFTEYLVSESGPDFTAMLGFRVAF